MKYVLVTGATGFIGRHIVPALLERGYRVDAVARDPKKIQTMPWRDKVRFFSCDIHDPDLDITAELGTPDLLVHLAWPGLPDYQNLSHVESTLPADFRFIRQMVTSGVRQIIVTGTCFEYGIHNGMMNENRTTDPVTPYGLAKDTLRKYLQALQTVRPFSLQWIRLFYLYGPGQNPNSLLSQLDTAIDKGDPVFNMSGGEQLRDYLPVEEAAHRIATMAEHPDCEGIFNCCSSRPISVRHLVEEHIAQRKATISLNLGHYSYPAYEPMAFWGDGQKMRKILERE
jgi:nucleoside-diphosphate-sugar epimerase